MQGQPVVDLFEIGDARIKKILEFKRNDELITKKKLKKS